MAKDKKEKVLSKKEQLALLVKDCNKALGVEGKVYLGSEHTETKRVLSGVLALDVVVGGGLPCAQLTELFGPESSGKTLLAMLAVAAVQKSGGLAVWVKGEGFDKEWAIANGVDVDNLLLIEAATGDTMLETALTMLESGLVNIMVIDSVQSLGTTREADAGIENESYGNAGAPQMWGRIMRRAYRAANSGKMDNTILIGISQVRSKIGFAKGAVAEDGQPSQIRALLHWKGVSVRCRKGEKFFTKPQGQGYVHAREFKLRCEKNKTAGTEGVSTSYIYQFKPFNGAKKGIDNPTSIFELGIQYGIIEQSGAHYKLDGEKLGFGAEEAKSNLRKSPELIKSLYSDIIEAVRKETD